MNSMSVSAIVCAFNEEHTLPQVVRALIGAEEVNEVIVINDGSIDGTHAALKEFSRHPTVRIIELSHNRGKGFAMAEGILRAESDILLFVDADLINFDKIYIPPMLRHILDGKAEMVIGHPTENNVDKKFNPFRQLAGERAVLKKDIQPLVDDIRNSGYGAEILINMYYAAQQKRVKYVWLWGLLHPITLHKHAPIKAMKIYLREAYQISRSIMKNYLLLFLIIRNAISRML